MQGEVFHALSPETTINGLTFCMRASDLYESYHKVANIEWVLENCSDAIELFKRTGKVFYRGTDDVSGITLMKPNKTARKAAFANMNLHTDLINSGDLGHLPKREIIMTSDLSKAKKYGYPFVALPTNGALIGCVNAEDVFYMLSNEKNNNVFGTHNLSSFYNAIKICLKEAYKIANISTTPIENTYIDSMRTLKKLLKALDGHEFTEDELLYIQEELDDNLITNVPIEILYEFISDKSIKPIMAIFKKNSLTSESISDMGSIVGGFEYWTDAPTVLLAEEIFTQSNT